MSTFTIKHDTQRYGDNTAGLILFGPRVVVSGVTADQAGAIADAMSGYSDAGLTDQYVVEMPENTPELAISEYNRLTQEEFRNRVLSPEFAASVDAAIPGGPFPVVVRETALCVASAERFDGAPNMRRCGVCSAMWNVKMFNGYAPGCAGPSGYGPNVVPGHTRPSGDKAETE